MEATRALETVIVIEDDESMRSALARLIRSVGLRVQTFSSAQEFLGSPLPEGPSCMVLDIRLPGMSGLQLQETLERTHLSIPIIFITGHGDVPMSVQAMKAGAVDFLQKPVNDQQLLDAVQRAKTGRGPAPLFCADPEGAAGAEPGRVGTQEQGDRLRAGRQ